MVLIGVGKAKGWHRWMPRLSFFGEGELLQAGSDVLWTWHPFLHDEMSQTFVCVLAQIWSRPFLQGALASPGSGIWMPDKLAFVS